VHAGKGVLGWVPAKASVSKSPVKLPAAAQDVKVVLGNKQMMLEEGIPISKPVDDYMRDMEVSHECSCVAPFACIQPICCLHFSRAVDSDVKQRWACISPVAWCYADTECVVRACTPCAQASCCTCIVVAVGGSVRAVLAITDPLKPEARGVVAALARRGLSVHLVTGDNWRTARAIAEQLAIINVCAECLPGAKADKIRVPSTLPPLPPAASIPVTRINAVRSHIFVT
jgi:hypothetical protein